MEEHLGLATYFRDNHLPKYALTYYFKIDPDNPEDRTYSVHCNERAPDDLREVPDWKSPMNQPPSWLLNREVCDRDLHQMVDDQPTVHQIHGLVKDETAPDSAGEPKNAQLRDLKTAGLRVEAVDGEREAAVHR